MRAVRHRPAALLPLEVWDVLIDGRPLYLLAESELPHAIPKLVQQLQAGSARRLRANIRLPQLTIDAVTLAGGGPTDASACALAQTGFTVQVAHDPVWVGETGGRALMRELSAADRGAVMEVGQTSIKYSDAAGRVRVPRSFLDIPLESESRARDPSVLRRLTLAFLAAVPRARSLPEALVLALPCEIEDSLAVAGCSYPWPAGDTQLIADLLSAAGLGDVPTLVLNDAELAAITVDLTRPASKATLVLTLGLGLGGAYLPARAALDV